ncbi:hypothetical protein B0H17DRAFT_1010809, partial [Mycena rosella]
MNSDPSQCPTCRATGRLSFGPHDLNFHVAPGTRHHGLLTSNEVPLEPDLLAVNSVISKTDARLAWLDTEILRLQDRLKELEEERTALSSFRAQNNAILSPLRRMPPEVLGEIFAWTLPSVKDALERGFSVGRSPWVLGQINSPWRSVALSTPSLWSLVAI